MDVKSKHFAAKSCHDPGKDGPDFAGADHSYSMTDEVETHETIELEIAIASAIVGPRNLAIEREEQPNGKLGHRVGRIIGDPYDFDAKLLCRCQVDMIETGGTRRNKLRAA